MIDPTNDTVEVYEDEEGMFRWHRIDGDNGRIVSDSAEGYVNESYAYKAAEAYNPNAKEITLRES